MDISTKGLYPIDGVIECALIKLRERNERLKGKTKERKSQTLKEIARIKGNHKFNGKVCKRYGSFSRYVVDVRCVQFATLKNKWWQQQNKKQRCFNQMLREAKKLKATLSWANLEAIKEIYLNCLDNYTVDHIVPLQGKNVCGLHVEYNLQYLTSIENSRKSNKFICD